MPDFAKIKPWLFYLVPFSASLIALVPQSSSNPLMVIPFFILAAYLLLSGRLASIRLNDPVFLFLLLVWLGWTWGALWSEVPFGSKVTWTILSVLPVTYLCAAGRDIKPLLYIICAGVTILAASTFYYMYVMEVHHWRAKLFFDDENILGALIAFVIPLTLSFFFTATRNWKIAICIAVAILFGGLFLTQSRSALLGCIIGLIPFFAKNRKLISKDFIRTALPFLLVLLVGFFVSGTASRIWLALQLDKDIIGRFYLWKAALEMSFWHPFTGVGLGLFHLHYPPLKSITDNSYGFWVHMDPLQWAVESGWGTALAVYALAGTVAWKYFKGNLTQLQIGAGASLLTIFATSHAGYVFHYVPILILSGLLLAQFAPSYVETRKLRLIPGISLTLATLGGIWIVILVAPSLYMWTLATDARARGDLPRFSKYIQLCIDKGSPQFPACRIEAARFLIDSSSQKPDMVLDWLNEVETYDKLEKATHFNRALYYSKFEPDKPDLAIAELEKSLAIDPATWQTRKKLVKLLVAKGELDKAYETLQEARKYQISSYFLDDFYELEADLYYKVHK